MDFQDARPLAGHARDERLLCARDHAAAVARQWSAADRLSPAPGFAWDRDPSRLGQSTPQYLLNAPRPERAQSAHVRGHPVSEPLSVIDNGVSGGCNITRQAESAKAELEIIHAEPLFCPLSQGSRVPRKGVSIRAVGQAPPQGRWRVAEKVGITKDVVGREMVVA